MTPKVTETLGSMIRIDLYERIDLDEELIFSERGQHAGLDVNGNLADIVC
jgi:hypothetical protein